MHAEEREDFESALRDNGYLVSDFIFDEKPNWPKVIGPITGTITIKRISTQKEKSYKTGNNTRWIADFEDDLKQGIYD